MKNQELKSYAHCVFRIFYHIVFITKNHIKTLSPIILLKLESHFQRICNNAGCKLIEFNGKEDHMHLLIDASPNIAPSRLVNTLKTISSREIKKEFGADLEKFYRKPVFWTRSYCIISAGGAPLDVLEQYIQNQKPS